MLNSRKELSLAIEATRRLPPEDEIKAARYGFGTWYLSDISRNLYRKRSRTVR